MTKERAAAGLCLCVLLLCCGLGLGRYTALSRGAVLGMGGAGLGTLPELGAVPVTIDLSRQDAKLNLNTASAAQLTELPGIGDALSARIVEYREVNGDFSSIEEVMAVRGIGESLFSRIRDYIYTD